MLSVPPKPATISYLTCSACSILCRHDPDTCCTTRERGFGAPQNAEPKQTVYTVAIRRRPCSHAAIVRRCRVKIRTLDGRSAACDRTERSNLHTMWEHHANSPAIRE